MRQIAQLQERIRMVIIEEINATNLIGQAEPENWIPRYIETMTNRITEIVADEITFGRK